MLDRSALFIHYINGATSSHIGFKLITCPARSSIKPACWSARERPGEKEARYCENFKDLKENPAIAFWLRLQPGKRRDKNRFDRRNQLVGPKGLKGTICIGCNISELAGHIQPQL
jgi:hypothetical protein